MRGQKGAGECDDSALVKRTSVLLLDRSPRTARGYHTGCGKDPVLRLLLASRRPSGANKTAQPTEDGEGSWGLLPCDHRVSHF